MMQKEKPFSALVNEEEEESTGDGSELGPDEEKEDDDDLEQDVESTSEDM